MNPSFDFHLSWDSGEASGSAADATWGSLSFLLDGHSVWGGVAESPNGFHWTWIEILEFLAEAWPWLTWEEGWPPGLSPRDPNEFEVRARTLLESLPPQKQNTEAAKLFEFRQRHDLACALQGAIVPSLWLVREGAKTWIASKSIAIRAPTGLVVGKLSALGEQIAARLAALEDARAKEAVATWNARLKTDVGEAISISTRIGPQQLVALVGKDVAAGFEIQPIVTHSEPTELMAAARMAAPVVDAEILKKILHAIRVLPASSTPILDDLSAEAQDFLSGSAFDAPATAGFELAHWLRNKHDFSEIKRVDPDRFLHKWGVPVTEQQLGTTALDAIACWGPRHGPAIVFNTEARHPKAISLAHEIAHLLVDRTDALPLADVLGVPAPRLAESRANAFAAELLMPQAVAGKEMATSNDAAATLAKLASHFGVSHEVIAWQTYNSGWKIPWPTFNLLRSKVSRPQFFLWYMVGAT